MGKCQIKLSWGTFSKTIELYVQKCPGHESQEKMEHLFWLKKNKNEHTCDSKLTALL